MSVEDVFWKKIAKSISWKATQSTDPPVKILRENSDIFENYMWFF